MMVKIKQSVRVSHVHSVYSIESVSDLVTGKFEFVMYDHNVSGQILYSIIFMLDRNRL